VIYPFNQTKNAELRAAVARYRSEFPVDRKIRVLNLGAEGARGLTSNEYIADFAIDNVHPTASRHKTLAGLLFDKVQPAIGIGATIIDDRNTASGTDVNTTKYTGSWQSVIQADSLNGDNHFSSTTNDSYEVEFYGDRVRLFGTKGQQNGIAAISIDGGPEILTDLYSSATAANSVLFQSNTLSHGYHKIRVRVTGQKNASSTGNGVAIDKLEIT
jgi:hypothetical protein